MSHQGFEGWFPECLVCGMGNLNTVICLNPGCHEMHDGRRINSFGSPLIKKDDGHWWKLCKLCNGEILSDPGSFGVYAICVDCFNRCVDRKVVPPISPLQAHKTRIALTE